MFKKSFLFFSAILLVQLSHAQGKRTLAGTEFWMTFTENIYTPPDSVLHLIVSPYTPDTITVFNPQVNVSETFPVQPGKQNIIYLKSNSLWYSRLLGSANTGVRISSKRLVQIQAVNRVDGSGDISSILPISVVENARNYMVNGVAGDNGKESQVAILAIDPGTTTIEIKISADLFTGQGAGSVFTRNLKQGQVFILQALDTQKMAGTTVNVINNCNRVVLFSGTKCARYTPTNNCFSCDALYEQMLPVGFAQSEYFFAPPPDNTKYSISVVAVADNTSITLNGVFATTINKGEHFTKQVSGPQYMVTDKPVNSAQVMHSSGCNGASNSSKGDPSIVQAVSFNQSVNEAHFPVFRSAGYKHFLLVYAEAATKPVFTLNALPIPAVNILQFSISGKTFWYGSIEVFTNNTYTLKSTTGFIALNYGMANAESYAAICGASFERSDADFTASPEYQCQKNSPVLFSAKGDSVGQISWQFGDGNTGTGNKTSHIYGKAGTYKVSMINPNAGKCTDTISRYVQVVDGPDLDVPKDTMPCIGAIYRITLPVDKGYQYNWENGSNTFSRSFSSNQTAIVRTTDTNGCESLDTIKVSFKDCNNYELKLANVFTPGTDNKNDEWRVIYTGYKEVKVSIYNRWGEVLYQYSLPDDAHWNGMVNNQFIECPEGVYFYKINAIANKEADNATAHGVIHLIR